MVCTAGRGLVRGAVAAAILVSAIAWAAEAPKTNGTLYEMEVMGVAPDPASGTPVVYLRGVQEKRELSMFIGPFEAQGIILTLQRLQPPRPYTHDLMLEVIHRLQGKVKRVVITGLRDNTYFATLILEAHGTEVVLDSRPSDAIALALRENAPIMAAEEAFVRVPRPGRPESESP
jgi:bifunctional DNase/RNase